jgi:flagellar capping protein FliD
MSRDSHKTVSPYLVGHQHHMATFNPFNLPMRPVSQWDDTRDRTSEQLHESAMYQLGLMKGSSTSTPATGPKKMHVASVSASDPFEAVHQQWEERGWLIQKHERRLKDSNKLLSKMWRRLDPYGRVLELLNTNPTVHRHAEQRAEPAFSESHSMQDLFYRLAAYDYLHTIDPGFGLPPSTSLADPALTEKRLNSLASTVKIQSGLLQEKNDTIEKLRTQLEHQRRSHMQQLSAYQKDKDDAIDRLEKQLKKVNVKLSRLHNATKSQPKPKPIAPVAKASVVKVC